MMFDFQATVDRVEIEALRAEFTDAAMTNDHARLASLFVADGVLSIPDAGVRAVGRDQIKALGQRREEGFDIFVQATHPGVVEVTGDVAAGRAYISEMIKLHDGASHQNYAIYHDRYQRAVDGWRFVERIYEIRYLDTTPLPGARPGPATAPMRD